MLFWDLLRDFFVKYIFGGTTSNGDLFSGYVGFVEWYGNGVFEEGALDYATSVSFPISTTGEFMQALNLADWLSTTATIISMVVICIGLFMLIRWFFKIGAGFIGLRG